MLFFNSIFQRSCSLAWKSWEFHDCLIDNRRYDFYILKYVSKHRFEPWTIHLEIFLMCCFHFYSLYVFFDFSIITFDTLTFLKITHKIFWRHFQKLCIHYTSCWHSMENDFLCFVITVYEQKRLQLVTESERKSKATHMPRGGSRENR